MKHMARRSCSWYMLCARSVRLGRVLSWARTASREERRLNGPQYGLDSNDLRTIGPPHIRSAPLVRVPGALSRSSCNLFVPYGCTVDACASVCALFVRAWESCSCVELADYDPSAHAGACAPCCAIMWDGRVPNKRSRASSL